MKHTKSRLFGAILLVLSAVLLLTGIFSGCADHENTPLYTALSAANAERDALAAAQEILTEAAAELGRTYKRSDEAIETSQACIDASNAAIETGAENKDLLVKSAVKKIDFMIRGGDKLRLYRTL